MKTENLSRDVISSLKSKNKTLCTAESCTGGLIGKLLTDVSGSSAVYLGGIISYTNEVKQKLLHVSPHTLHDFSAVSEQTAAEMAVGVRKQIDADLSVSVTGIAGPNSDEFGHEVGLVYIALCSNRACTVRKLQLHGSRDEIRHDAANAVFEMILEELK